MREFRLIRRPLGVFAVGATLAVGGILLGTADADGVTGSVSGTGSGMDVAMSGGSYWAGLINLAVDGGGSIQTYCIDLNTNTQVGVEYEESSWSEGNVPNLGKVAWVLKNGYPTKSTSDLLTAINLTLEPDLGSLSANEAAAGTQAAVWWFSDGASLAAGNPAAVQAVYDYLVANAVALSEPAPTLSIDPLSLSGGVGEMIGPFTVTTSAASVALTATGGTITDDLGNPLASVGDGGTFYVTLAAEGSVTITGEASATLYSGRVFITTAESAKQKLIAATSSPANTTFSVTAQASEATTTSEVTTTSEATTTSEVTTTSEATTTSEVTTTSEATSTSESDSQGPSSTGESDSRSNDPDGDDDDQIPAAGATTTATAMIAMGLMLMGYATLLASRRRVV